MGSRRRTIKYHGVRVYPSEFHASTPLVHQCAVRRRTPYWVQGEHGRLQRSPCGAAGHAQFSRTVLGPPRSGTSPAGVSGNVESLVYASEGRRDAELHPGVNQRARVVCSRPRLTAGPPARVSKVVGHPAVRTHKMLPQAHGDGTTLGRSWAELLTG